MLRNLLKKIKSKIGKKATAKPVAKKVLGAKKKKTTKKKATQKPVKAIGAVTHYYNEIGVAIVRFKEKVPAGTHLAFRGATTDFEETIKSMQYDHKSIAIAPKGKQIGIKVKKRVRQGDLVYYGGKK